MRWAGGYEPPKILGEPVTWMEHRNVWDIRRQIREQRAEAPKRAVYDTDLMPMDVMQQLAAQSAIDLKRPPVDILINQIPDVVYWLRAQMTARPLPDDDGENRSSGKPGSKPPFRIAFMSAADREVAALAFWASHYNIFPSTPLWQVNGVVQGLLSSNMDAMWELSGKLADELMYAPIMDGLLDHPSYGLWSIRSQHYGLWPQLAAIFESQTAKDQPEGLF